MSTFTTTKSYETTTSFIPYAIERVRESFVVEGFEVNQKAVSYNKTILEITKGNLVKKVIGLKQGLEVTFESSGKNVNVGAKGTVIKDQLIASFLYLFITPVVIIPQIIGLIQQSGLDDKAFGVIDTAYAIFKYEQPTYCPHCGYRITGNPSICPHCGTQL